MGAKSGCVCNGGCKELMVVCLDCGHKATTRWDVVPQFQTTCEAEGHAVTVTHGLVR